MRRSLSLVFVALAASPAAALDLGNGFSIIGDVELEYLAAGSDQQRLAIHDLTLGWRSQGSGSLGFGLDVTTQGYNILGEDIDTHILWAAGVLVTPYGEIAAGRPQPVLERMFPLPQPGGTRYVDFLLASIGGHGGSFLVQAALQSDDVDFTGLTLKGSAGDVTYGAGVHRIDAGSETADGYELGAIYRLGGTELFAAYEAIEVPGNTFDRWQIAARYAAERWSVGVHHQDADYFLSGYGITTLFADYRPMDALTIGAQVLATNPGEFELYGLSAEYRFGPGAFGQLGYVTQSSGSGSDDIFSASLGYRF
ncbi:porin [Rhodobacter calidifons]|uniref:Porin n=1 Tax=Rhodobacter calidifons TaxID=2715277 RepID=A0ABX0G838_9RHOB|nr:porin [Rhodobacter calidifons]NHB77453.1 porin [Rhodobacter calidifons]